MRAALYLRVSKDEQHAENQRDELERLARARGWEPVWFEEPPASGSKMDRPELGRMLEAVRRGEVGAVVVWALDRLGRSMVATFALVVELDRLGCVVASVREAWLDTSGPVRPLLLAIFTWAAEQERARLIERTKAGLARARRQGVPLGRPRLPPASVAAALERVRTGESVSQAARAAGVSRRALYRAMPPLLLELVATRVRAGRTSAGQIGAALALEAEMGKNPRPPDPPRAA